MLLLLCGWVGVGLWSKEGSFTLCGPRGKASLLSRVMRSWVVGCCLVLHIDIDTHSLPSLLLKKKKMLILTWTLLTYV